MSAVFCDIGGTHVRFARMQDGQFKDIRKYKARAYKDFLSALNEYSKQKNGVHISTAFNKRPDGTWQKHEHDTWSIIDPNAITNDGWDVKDITHDFEASVWGIIHHLKQDADTQPFIKLHAGSTGPKPNNDIAVIGVGTGLGLGYARWNEHSNTPHIQTSFGGHMLATAVTDEQKDVLNKIAAMDLNPCFENVVSARGAKILHKIINGHDIEKSEDACQNGDVLRLMHEFLGLFLNQAVMFGHCFNGVYFTGGVMEDLIQNEMLDLDTILEFFQRKTVVTIDEPLSTISLTYIDDPYLPLKGLYAKSLSDN